MTDQTPQHGPPAGDPARRGGRIGGGLVPDEVTEGRAETAAHAVGPQPDEGLVEPGGVDTGEPTQQLRRPQAQPRLPGPLDPTRPRQGQPPDPDATDVLPLDELLDEEGQPATHDDSRPVAVVPDRSDAGPRPSHQALTRLRADATTMLRSGSAQVTTRLRHGDNAVIVATVLVAVLLLTVVATVG